jgi:hypothetical protein
MTLTLKSWFEVRRRMGVVLLGWIFVGIVFYAGTLDGSHVREEFSRASSVEIAVLMVFGSLLAGSGVTTQSCNAAMARMPDSVLFTLSLPVSRRGAFLTRAAQGSLGLVVIVFLFWSLLPVLFRSLPGAPAWRVLVVALLFQFVAAALAYSVKLLAECLISETTQALIAAAAVAIGGVGAGLRWPPLVRFLSFASGATYMTTGQISWIGLSACVALSCLLVSSAVHVIERREF